jgi:hypothetical protein
MKRHRRLVLPFVLGLFVALFVNGTAVATGEDNGQQQQQGSSGIGQDSPGASPAVTGPSTASDDFGNQKGSRSVPSAEAPLGSEDESMGGAGGTDSGSTSSSMGSGTGESSSQR